MRYDVVRLADCEEVAIHNAGWFGFGAVSYWKDGREHSMSAVHDRAGLRPLWLMPTIHFAGMGEWTSRAIPWLLRSFGRVVVPRTFVWARFDDEPGKLEVVKCFSRGGAVR